MLRRDGLVLLCALLGFGCSARGGGGGGGFVTPPADTGSTMMMGTDAVVPPTDTGTTMMMGTDVVAPPTDNGPPPRGRAGERVRRAADDVRRDLRRPQE